MADGLVNPYIAGAPVTEARMFFGREDVFDWIENSLVGKYTDHILVIHGQRRVGKTSVLKQLGNRLPKRYIPVFFDLQGRTHASLDRFLWWLAREIVRILKQDRGIEIPVPDKEAFSADLEYFETHFLASLLPLLGDGSLLLTFDEFDNLEESEIRETLAGPLVNYLRRLLGKQGLNFIFSIGSSGRKLENMQAAYTDFFKTALYKKISFLNEEQTRSLITRPVEGILEFDKPAVNRINKITGGHPYFTQLICHELFARCQRTNQRNIGETDVEAVLDDVVERGTVNLKFVWDEASDIEKWALSSLAHLDRPDNHALTAYLRKQNVRFSESDLTSGLLHLREKDILTSENRFVVHLLRLWLQKNRPIEQVREELTEVNPIANRYTEIGLEFKNSGQYEKALESFQEALAVSAGHIQAQVSIALVYMDQKAYDKAVREFDKALAIDDEDVTARTGLCDAHLALGDLASQKGRWKEAAQSYQRVLGINEEHTEARQRMAEINRQRAEKALAEGRDEEALSAFADALDYAPEDETLSERLEALKAEKKVKVIAAQIARSEKEAGAKNWEAAVHTLEEAHRLAPDDPDIQERLAEAHEKLREGKLVSLRIKAQAAAKAGKFSEALTAWQEYLSLEPQDRKETGEEITRLKRLQELDETYNQAQRAIADKSYDKAIGLLKDVIVKDESFRDTSRLLVQVIELRRSSRSSRFTLPVFSILKGLLIVIGIAGLGIGAYFVWTQWGNKLTSLFAVEQKLEKVCFIMTGMDDGRSYWNSRINQAMTDVAKEYELASKTFITQTVKEKYEAQLTSMIKTEKCDLILGTGTWLKDSFYQYAKENPNVKFSLIDVDYGDITHPLPENLIEQTFKTFDSGRLAGYLAAGLTKTGRVGTFAAEDSTSNREYMKGFVKGVEEYNGRHNTQVQSFGFNLQYETGLFAGGYVGTNANRILHSFRAESLINTENVDVLFIVSSPNASNRALDAVKNMNTNKGTEVKIIGADIDWAAYFTAAGWNDWADLFITSATKDFERMVKEVISRTVEGTYRGETIEGNGSNQGVGLAPLNESVFTIIPDGLKADLAQLQYEAFGIVPKATSQAGPPPTATADPRILNPANQHLYQYMDQNKSWHDARDICASQGGYLVTIQYADENEFVYQLTNGNTWLGATDEAEEGFWVWVSGEPWDFQNWEQGEPSNSSDELGSENFLTLGASSQWNDIPDLDNNFVCEWEPAPSAEGSATPVLDPAIQIAFDAIQNEAPTYEKSFEFSWDREFYNDESAGTRIDDGKLIVIGENQKENRGYLILPPGINISDMFAVEFEFRILESTPNGRCSLGNWGEGKGIGVSFLPQGQAELWGSGIEKVVTSNFDVSKTNKYTLISFGDQIAAFINAQFVATIPKPEGATIYEERFFNATDVIVCEFDNYKIWDLSGANLHQ